MLGPGCELGLRRHGALPKAGLSIDARGIRSAHPQRAHEQSAECVSMKRHLTSSRMDPPIAHCAGRQRSSVTHRECVGFPRSAKREKSFFLDIYHSLLGLDYLRIRTASCSTLAAEG